MLGEPLMVYCHRCLKAVEGRQDSVLPAGAPPGSNGLLARRMGIPKAPQLLSALHAPGVCKAVT